VFHDGKLLIRSRVSPWARDPYGYFQAVDPEAGLLAWRHRIDGQFVGTDDQPLISGGRAYVASEGFPPGTIHFYTIDLGSGRIIRHQLVQRLRQPFAERLGILYFGSSTPAAFDSGREAILWQTELRGRQGLSLNVVARGVLDPAQGEIYLGDWERDLYVLSARTGEVQGKVDVRGYWRGEFFSPLKGFFGSYGVKRLAFIEGFLFVGTVDGSLFVFRRSGQQ
jgi:outer membrane protein assembly factor BamB